MVGTAQVRLCPPYKSSRAAAPNLEPRVTLSGEIANAVSPFLRGIDGSAIFFNAPGPMRRPRRSEKLTLHTHSWCAATRHYISDRKVSVSRVEARLLHLHSRSRKTRRAVLEPRDRLSVFALPNISCARSAGPIVIGPCLKTRSKRRSTQSHTVRWFVQPVERKLRRARRRLTMSCHFNTIIGRV